MKRTLLIIFVMAIFVVSGCSGNNAKNQYLPEAKDDKIYTTISGGEGQHKGAGYTLSVPDKGYRYEKDYDDGKLEETWDYIRRDDVEIKVTTYKNMDEISARADFLRDNDDYIFEDLTGYSICGTERDGDVLWFNLHESDGTVYIVSWEYPKNTDEALKKELSDIAATFKVTE